MKKFLSVLLTIVMFSSFITPVAFAADAVVTKASISIGSSFAGVPTTLISEEAYGGPDVGYSRKIPASNINNAADYTLSNSKTIATSYGDKIRISFQLARETEGSAKYFDIGIKGKCGTTALGYSTGAAKFNFATGTVVSDKTNNLPAPSSTLTKAVATPAQTWTTYDFVYTVGRDDDVNTQENETIPNTYSVYVNGICSINEATFEKKDGTDFAAITEISGVSFFHRSYNWAAYISPSITFQHYPASIASQCVITADPMADSDGDSYADIDTNKYFAIQTDGSLMVNNLSVTSAAIAELAPEGWTFTYANTDGADEISDAGYLIMKKEGGPTYYKKVISEIYTSLLNVNCTELSPVTSTTNIHWAGVRWLNSTGGTKTFVKGVEGRGTGDQSVSLSYENPSKGQMNGFTATAQGKYPSSAPYSSMVETGRIAYETSVLIPQAPTNTFVFEVYYNGTVASGASVVSNTVWSPVAEFGTAGKLTSREDKFWFVEPDFEGFKINFGEWYRFTCVMDTEKNTGEFYINGEKAITLKTNNDITTLNYFNVGFSTRGETDTSSSKFAFVFDDISIKKLRTDWTVPTIELTSKDANVTIDNKNGVIFGEFDSLQAFSDAVVIPEGATYKFYTEKTITSAAEEGAVGKYLLVKNADETIIREYVIASNDLIVTGLDVSALDTEKGTKEITVSIENMTASDINTMVAIASYSSDGSLVALDTLTKSAVFKEITDYTVSLDVTEDEPINEIKAFVWKASGITPMRKNVSTKNN